MENFYLCTGSIIHRSWVLSACHCFRWLESGNTTAITIIAGSVNTEDPTPATVTVQSAFLLLHPDCKVYPPDSADNDIALVKTETPFDFSGCCVKSVRLVRGDFPKVDVLPCKAVGFGITSHQDTSNTALHKLDVKATHRTTLCYDKERILRGSPDTLNELVCACGAGAGKGMCMGDSGGPLVYKGLVIGVMSYMSNRTGLSTTCATADAITFYFHTAPYLEWIRSHVPDLPEPALAEVGTVKAVTSPPDTLKAMTSESGPSGLLLTLAVLASL